MPNDSLKNEVEILAPEKKEMPREPEKVPAIEIVEPIQPVPEQGAEIAESTAPSVGEAPTEDRLVAAKRVPVAVPAQIDRLEDEIDDILEEDLKELYVAMPPDKQVEFREKGEETRSKIRQLVSSTKVNAKKIFALIRAWLKMIPGVNRFFLEQEAKIKTDKILLVSEEGKKRSQDL